MAIKELLNAIHDVFRWLLHIILIPLVALLKGITSVSSHLTTELEKV
jgi:hypothetical protein